MAWGCRPRLGGAVEGGLQWSSRLGLIGLRFYGLVEWGSRIDGFVDVFVFHVVEIRVVPAHVGVDRRTLELSHMGVNITVVAFGVIGHVCSIPLYEDSITDRKASEGIDFVRSSPGRIDGMRNGVLRRYL